MENRFWKQNKGQLLLISAIVAITCLIALAFFRSDIFIKGIRIVFSILTPFTYGFVIAYMLKPLSRGLEALMLKLLKKPADQVHGWIRMTSIFISLALLLIVLIWLLLTVLPQIVNSIAGIIASLPVAVKDFETWLHSLDTGEMSHEIITYADDAVNTLYVKLQSFLETSLLPNMQEAIGKITSSFMGLVDVIKNVGLGCIISIYFLSGWEKFGMQGKLVVYSAFPRKVADWIREEIHFVDRMFSGFIIGKLVDSAIIGLICMVFCTIAKMPYVMLVSVIVGVTNVIPFFGPYLGAIPSVLLIMTGDLTKAIVFLIFIIILQQVDGNVIGPKILGDKLGISSFWILFSILFFGALWGLPGMLFGAPFFAVIYDLIRKMVFYGLKERNCEELKDQYIEKYGE